LDKNRSYIKDTHDLRNGWMYVERSFTTTANERLAKYENGSEVTKEQIKKSTDALDTLGIYNERFIIKNTLKFEPILKALSLENGECLVTDTGIATRERIISHLTIQLGNPKVREKDRSHLARLLEDNGDHCPKCMGYGEVCKKSGKCRKMCTGHHKCDLTPCPEKCFDTSQLYQPLFYTYDDKPCFNLVSGIMQAQEDMWTKTTIRVLQKDVEELKKAGQKLREEVETLKNAPSFYRRQTTTPNAPSNYVPVKIPSYSSDNLPQRLAKCKWCSGSGLPAGWTQHTSTKQDKGKAFYVNPKTHESQWARPPGSCEVCKGNGTLRGKVPVSPQQPNAGGDGLHKGSANNNSLATVTEMRTTKA